ncbi:Hypothetical predicted protein [Podarcis lilfordi]|uniref:Uncharacterized protein n=1 Tax=Podarcis lilfordi TaxID=74358 RepID=A0AA35PH24_9SAUR|nr:Hypothetical predicted protein [Podarcis lilfordi]
MKLPMCVSNAAIRLELRIASLETVIWKRVFGYWLSSWHRLPNHYLFQCLWRDDFVNPWVGKIHAKLLSIGISPADSLKMNLRSAKRLIEQRLADIENQHNLAGDTDPSVTLQVARFLNAVISHTKPPKTTTSKTNRTVLKRVHVGSRLQFSFSGIRPLELSGPQAVIWLCSMTHPCIMMFTFWCRIY